MLILAIDTATDRLGLALRRDDTTMAELHLDLGRKHAEKILVGLDGLLADLGVLPRQIGGIAVSLGPGSFTGLRIGLAFAKGLALATDAQLVGIPSLTVLAAGALPWVGAVVPCLDARRGEVYYSAYHLTSGGVEHLDPDFQAGAPAAVAARCRLLGPRVLLVGTGVEVVHAIAGSDAALAPRELALPRASVLAALGAEKLRRGESAEIDALEPLYVRRPDAVVRRDPLAVRA
jgi:tRNA threonylcarbamoyladenosine biosynthesis protein TsaB